MAKLKRGSTGFSRQVTRFCILPKTPYVLICHILPWSSYADEHFSKIKLLVLSVARPAAAIALHIMAIAVLSYPDRQLAL